MTRLPLLLLLAGLPVRAEPLKAMIPDFRGVNVPADKLRFFTEHFGSQLAERGARVTTSDGIAQVLGMERQKQLLGCSDAGTECLAELANALGGDVLIVGSVATVGAELQLNVRVVASQTGQEVAAYQARVASDAKLLDELELASFSVVDATAKVLKRDPPRPLRASPVGPVLGAVTAGLAVAGAVAAVVLLRGAAADFAALPQKPGDAPLPLSEARSLAARGEAQQTAGWVAVGVAGSAAVASALCFVFGLKPRTPVSVFFTGSAAAVVLGGSW